MAYIICEPCVNTKDTACVDACPVTAIFPEDNVPEQWQNYIPMNYEHFGQSK